MSAAMSGVTTMSRFTHSRARTGLALGASSALAAGVLLSAATVPADSRGERELQPDRYRLHDRQRPAARTRRST